MSDAASSGVQGSGAASGAPASSGVEASVAGPAGKPAGGRGRRWSIRWRLIASLAGVSLFAVVVVGLIFYTFLSGYVVDQQQSKLLDQATVTSEQIQTVWGLGYRVDPEAVA